MMNNFGVLLWVMCLFVVALNGILTISIVHGGNVGNTVVGCIVILLGLWVGATWPEVNMKLSRENDK